MNLFGEYIRRKREFLGIPQRKIAASLDIDTSIFSKIERGERRAQISMLKVLATQLDLPLKNVEYEFFKDSILTDFSDLEFMKPCLSKIIEEL